MSYSFGTALRRIDYVHVDVRSRPAAAHVVGVAHRLPTQLHRPALEPPRRASPPPASPSSSSSLVHHQLRRTRSPHRARARLQWLSHQRRTSTLGPSWAGREPTVELGVGGRRRRRPHAVDATADPPQRCARGLQLHARSRPEFHHPGRRPQCATPVHHSQHGRGATYRRRRHRLARPRAGSALGNGAPAKHDTITAVENHAGKVGLQPDVDWHLFIGDDSAIPVTLALVESVPVGTTVLAVLEVEDPAHEQPAARPITWLHRRGAPFADPTLVLDHVLALELPNGPGAVYLNGERKVMLEARRLLVERGVDPDAIVLKASRVRDEANGDHGEPVPEGGFPARSPGAPRGAR